MQPLGQLGQQPEQHTLQIVQLGQHFSQHVSDDPHPPLLADILIVPELDTNTGEPSSSALAMLGVRDSPGTVSATLCAGAALRAAVLAEPAVLTGQRAGGLA